jgi:hypothetical protein
MTVADKESSADQGNPVELYLFTYGSGLSYFAYTDAELSISYGGKTYEPIAIERSAVSSSGSLDKSQMSVNMPKTASLVDLFLIYPPSRVVTLTVFRGHVGDSQFIATWSGRVISKETKEDIATFGCEPASTSMNRNALRRNAQYGCGHALYRAPCGANRTAATVSSTPTSVNSETIFLPTGWNGAHSVSSYLGGLVKWTFGDTEERSIISASANSITISGFARNLTPGVLISISRGCPRTIAGCESHNAIQSFGGMPWIPRRNPYKKV